MAKKEQWRTIGEVCVDSAYVVICDPLQAAQASKWCDDYFRKTDLNAAAINNQGAAQMMAEASPLASLRQPALATESTR